MWALSTGALKAAKINNIYDMAGNMYERTMEGRGIVSRVSRGESFDKDSSISRDSIATRSYSSPITSSYNHGFRIALYIK